MFEGLAGTFPIGNTHDVAKDAQSKGKQTPESIAMGDRLRSEREKKKIKLRELSRLTGVPHGTISRIETGYRDPESAEDGTLQKILAPLDLRGEWVRYGRGEVHLSDVPPAEVTLQHYFFKHIPLDTQLAVEIAKNPMRWTPRVVADAYEMRNDEQNRLLSPLERLENAALADDAKPDPGGEELERRTREENAPKKPLKRPKNPKS